MKKNSGISDDEDDDDDEDDEELMKIELRNRFLMTIKVYFLILRSY